MVPQRDGVALRGAFADAREHLFEAVGTSDARQRASALRSYEAQAGIHAHSARLECPREEPARGRGPASEGRTRVAALRRAPQPIAQLFEIDLGDLHISGRRDEVRQIGAVGADGGRRQAAHVGEVGRERVDRLREKHESSLTPTARGGAAPRAKRPGVAITSPRPSRPREPRPTRRVP